MLSSTAAPLVNSSTPHLYSTPRALFDQPTLSASLLTKFSSANKAAFKALKTSKEYTFGEGATAKKVAQGKSLEELVKAAGGDEKIVTSVLEALMEELEVQKTYAFHLALPFSPCRTHPFFRSRPVLLAIDDAQPLFLTSSYISPSYHSLETYDLVFPRLLLSYISGARSFSTGAVLLSPSFLSKIQSPALTDFLASPSSASSSSSTSSQQAKKVLESAYDRKTSSQYASYSEVLNSGVRKLEVPERLTRGEAVGIVRLLKGWRGTREGASSPAIPCFSRLLSACAPCLSSQRY